MVIVNACLKIIKQCKPRFWALENPTGYLRKYLGKPEFTFQPWQFGDPWTKSTDIWGNFIPPKPVYSRWEDVPNKLPIYIRPNRSKPSIAYLHKSEMNKIPQFRFAYSYIQKDADLRAITPPGFAKAFYKVNK